MTPTDSLHQAVIPLSIALLSHFIFCRMNKGKNAMKTGLVFAAFFTVGMAAYQIQRDELDVVAIYIFISTWLAYLMALINIMNSVTLKMLSYLARTNSGKIQIKSFDDVFTQENGIESRLTALENNSFIESQNGFIKLQRKSRILTRVIEVTSGILSINKK